MTGKAAYTKHQMFKGVQQQREHHRSCSSNTVMDLQSEFALKAKLHVKYRTRKRSQ